MKKGDYYTKFQSLKNDTIRKWKSDYKEYMRNVRKGAEREFHDDFSRNIYVVRENHVRNDLIREAGLEKFMGEVNKAFNGNKNITWAEVFNEKVSKLEGNIQDKLKILAELEGLHEFYVSYYMKEVEKFMPVKNTPGITKSSIQWTGKSITEFVQLIYALHCGEYLKGEITKIVPQIARFLNYELGADWEDNFSKSVNKSNNEYKPEIFSNLEKAFQGYKAERLKINKSNKSK